MNHLNIVLNVMIGVSLVSGGSRYIAIPINEIDIIELNPISQSSYGQSSPTRYPRQTETLGSEIPYEDYDDASPRVPRSDVRVLDYVDFGAHTGNNGAYTWYANYPTHR